MDNKINLLKKIMSINHEKITFSNVFWETCYIEKALAYTYHETKNINKNFQFPSEIEKYCLGVEYYNKILMYEGKNIEEYFKEFYPFPFACKGFFLSKFLYKNEYQREISDVDFICLNKYKNIILKKMISLGFKPIRYNDTYDLTIPFENIHSILFQKIDIVVIKVDFFFIEENSIVNHLIMDIAHDSNKINDSLFILYLILLSIDMKKEESHSLKVMKLIDLVNVYRYINKKELIVKTIATINQFPDYNLCLNIINYITWEDFINE